MAITGASVQEVTLTDQTPGEAITTAILFDSSRQWVYRDSGVILV